MQQAQLPLALAQQLPLEPARQHLAQMQLAHPKRMQTLGPVHRHQITPGSQGSRLKLLGWLSRAAQAVQGHRDRSALGSHGLSIPARPRLRPACNPTHPAQGRMAVPRSPCKAAMACTLQGRPVTQLWQTSQQA